MLLVVPLVAYIDSSEPALPERRPWEPDWRVWRPTLGALVAAGAASQTDGGAELALVILAFGFACRALNAALPYRQGLREHRQ
jgi:hypothetical protein